MKDPDLVHQMLPRLLLPAEYNTVNDVVKSNTISITSLCMALQNGCHFSQIKDWLQRLSRSIVEEVVSSKLRGCSPLFYAVERHSPECIALLVEYGADVNTDSDRNNLPLLAFAIFDGMRTAVNSTEVVRILLAHGADPEDIPKDMWEEYLDLPSPTVTDTLPLPDSWKTEWCTPAYRQELYKALNLTHRYLLNRASRLPALTKRDRQLAKLLGITELLKMPFFLIGQLPVARLIIEDFIAHLMLRMSDEDEPYVVAFAGPSGHGKTELAKRLGSLLSVETFLVDAAQMRHDWDIFGSRNGYVSAQEGSRLNNFLAVNAG
jgi:ATP-dependent Clp protease ATP-binding subunit ClpB